MELVTYATSCRGGYSHRHSLEWGGLSAEVQSAYSTAPADRARIFWGITGIWAYDCSGPGTADNINLRYDVKYIDLQNKYIK